MNTVTSAEMRRLELNSEALGVTGFILMENAGAAVAQAVHARVKGRVAVYAGSGGKAGDAYVAARRLASLGHAVTLVCVEKPENNRNPHAARHYEILRNMNTVEIFDYPHDAGGADAVVDGLLGTGFRPPLRGDYLEAVKEINDSEALVVSIDVPSGCVADSEKSARDAVEVDADVVVTMHASKPCLKRFFTRGGAEVVVADIGVPREAELFVGPGDVAVYYPRRAPLTKKGDGGKVLVVAGSETYTGAALLTCLGAFAGGADLVYLVSTHSTVSAARATLPELICHEYPGEALNPRGVGEASTMLSKVDCLAVGPGLSLSGEVTAAVERLLEEASKMGKPVVVDADAIRSFSALRGEHRVPPNDYVLTPHSNEFKALTGNEPPTELAPRITRVLEAARATASTVLLKGYCDVAASGSAFRLSLAGTPAMAVAGTGDVLTGVAAAFRGRGLDSLRAASAAAYVVGVAGSVTVSEEGENIAASHIAGRVGWVLAHPLEAAARVGVRRIQGVTGGGVEWERILKLASK